MAFIKKEEITQVAQTYNMEVKESALKQMREEIEKTLEEAMATAQREGNDSSYLSKKLTIPDYFMDVKGFYQVPDEIEKELNEAGYHVRMGYQNEYTIY